MTKWRKKEMKYLYSACFFLSLSSVCHSASTAFNASVERTMIDEEHNGGCMVYIVPSPSDQGLFCRPNWVTLSCVGEYNSETFGHQKLAAAQLALIAGSKIWISVTDNKKHDGFCFAQRIVNYAE
jgi:hypothetical protein